MNYPPCVRSGFCCKQRPCAYGLWNKEQTQCAFLEVEKEFPDFILYKCGKYEEIKTLPGSDIHPSFGSGCSSTLFNDDRNKILKHILNRIKNEMP